MNDNIPTPTIDLTMGGKDFKGRYISLAHRVSYLFFFLVFLLDFSLSLVDTNSPCIASTKHRGVPSLYEPSNAFLQSSFVSTYVASATTVLIILCFIR